MNCETFHLKELELAIFQIPEVLRCILHTIMFHRALGLVRPKDVDMELFEITYVQCGDKEFEKTIEEKINLLSAWAERHPNKKAQICLSFYETRNKPGTWFSSKQERFYWEQWFITLNILPSKTVNPKLGRALTLDSAETAIESAGKSAAALEASLREVLFQILLFVNEKKDHIPAVVGNNTISFPYEITMPSLSDSTFKMDMFKRMLHTSTPIIPS